MPILQDPSSRALYLFPTKALAQDQLAELQALCETLASAVPASRSACSPTTATRRRTRGGRSASRAHLVLSNPDMLHSGILPHHPRWAKLFENLRYVVIDELHAYRGVFGSHLCNVLRRLRRICRHYGSNPVFLCSSATIANPRELAERLTEQPFELVDRSGAPRGEKFFVFVNPPVVNHQLGIRRSYLERDAAHRVGVPEAQPPADRLRAEPAGDRDPDDVSEGRFRRTCRAAPERIRGYRGGYLPNRRREIEKGLREGAVRAVVSTNALELGIDIGALDVCVMAGYPGTIAATWQRAGRAGRRASRSAAVMVASSAPLDQFIVRNPSYFFDALARARADRSRQPAHPGRSHQVRGLRAAVHARARQFGAARSAGDARRSSPSRGSCTGRGGAGDLGRRRRGLAQLDLDERVVSGRRGQPALGLVGQLRHRRHDARAACDRRDRFHERPGHAAPEGDLHRRGQLYQVERLDFEGRKAFVREIDCDYYTDAITYTRVTILDTFAERRTSSPTVDGRVARRSPRRVARRRLQEDQVLHERERRVGRARSARAADAHDVVLADDSARR